ncbi:hypothetical protein FHX06_003017 [Rhizobium sp. BK512]|jgi:hypothetical protein|uniref:hypothetical protein n=1 Tax=Rhizobium sp. BK512 TaxID=2587010 RepID=UPI000DE19ABD|nr:hypothetical protein [Rhizobium sp. BK512]MBB3561690.1 hypothetical protein [Rhizobium sp. BK512]
MYVSDAKVTHRHKVWHVDFFGDAGEQLTVRLPEAAAASEEAALDRAREMMVQLTPFGTRGGKPSLNRYDSLSNGNFDDDQTLVGVKH